MNVITSPETPRLLGFFESLSSGSLFLAGSIEMGKAVEWQRAVIARYADVEGLTIFNPRRADWDATWSQSPDHPRLIEQIDWELDRLDEADLVFFYLQRGTLSPISMMELGREVASGPTRVVVVCEPGFWREANVHRLCLHEDIEVHSSLEAGLQRLDALLGV